MKGKKLTFILFVVSCGVWRGGRSERTVGRWCEETTDCSTGAFCTSNKMCACRSTFVAINGFCWIKVNPGETGCRQSRQCDAVWPGAYCLNGECKCPDNQAPFITRDGPICLNYGYCPLNEDKPKFRNELGEIQRCPFGLDQSCPLGYDCFCNMPIEACAADDALTYCCPSRALTCITALDQGHFPATAGRTEERWFHNPVTNGCESFAYRGDGGNANNFRSKDHCESYCQQTCPRGQPQYRPQTFPSLKESVRSCSASPTNHGNNGCDSKHDCVIVGTENLCCPTADFICSEHGGMIYYNPPMEPYDEGVPISKYEFLTFPRFYYNKMQRKCLPFNYKGQGGNFNHFLLETHCDQYCSKLVCAAGDPLKEASGSGNMACNEKNICPDTHECIDGLCCPSKNMVCHLERMAGNCGSYTKRWWYNIDKGNCEQFIFSGCQGNANNFHSYRQCLDFCNNIRVETKCMQGKALKNSRGDLIVCGGDTDSRSCPGNYFCFYDGKTYGCCPTQEYTCSTKFEIGMVCGPKVTRWYYDRDRRECLTFEYNGCDGDSNNFPTEQDCQDYCRVESCPDGGDIWKRSGGFAPPCHKDSDCPQSTHFCSSVTKWTGSGYKTTNYCCPTKSYVCSAEKDVGVSCGGGSVLRWHFSKYSRMCESFTYNGCGGNRNNFPTENSCQNYCLSSGCPAGSTVFKNRSTNKLAICNLSPGASMSGCPDGFKCYQSELLKQNICCGIHDEFSEVCPADSEPYIDAVTVQPKQCTPNVEGSCPGGYMCWYSTQQSAIKAYYCCRKPKGAATNTPEVKRNPTQQLHEICPAGLVPSYEESNSENGLRRCSPNASPNDLTAGGCVFASACLWSESLKYFICCTGFLSTTTTLPISTTPQPKEIENSVCPPFPIGLVPVVQGSGFRRCNPQSKQTAKESCPEQSVCLYSETVVHDYVCCKLPETASLLYRLFSSSRIVSNST